MSFVLNSSNRVLAKMALASVIAMATPGAVPAEELSSDWILIRPLYAISFEVGRKQVLSYFLSKHRACDLTVMITDKPDKAPGGREIPPVTTTRLQTKIHGGNTAWLDTAEGKALEYACVKGAQLMKVRQVNQFASNATR